MKGRLFSKSKIIAIIILFVIAITISVLLNNNIFLEPPETAPSSSEMNIIYADIIEHNRIMLENPVEYGDKYCSGYVSIKKDEYLHKAILEDVRILSDKICKDAKTDFDKVKAISYYVAENIYYNHIAADSKVTADTISLETVLNTKTATCAGYSNLFSALCNMQGIYCVNLRGGTYVRNFITSEHLLNVPMNHEWNAVLIDNDWIFIDTTWMSDNEYSDEGYIKADSLEEQYFDMSLEEMSYEHRIDIIDYRNFKSSVNAFNE